MATARTQHLWIATALAGVALVAYLRNLVGGVTFVGRDHQTLVTPARRFLGETIAAGRIPQWWEGVGMGVAFAANPMHGAFYPLAWISAFAPGSFGADLVIVLHVFLLGLGTAWFSRRLGAQPVGAALAGAIAMLCGYTASMAVNGVPLMTLAWVPWVGWAADIMVHETDRRRRIRASLVLAAMFALAILSGDPAGVITAGLLALVIVATRAKQRGIALGCVAAASLGALLLAAIVVVPAYALLGESGRAGGMDLSDASSWSMHPLRFVEWIWPQALGDGTVPSRNLARAFANSSTDAFFAPAWSISLFIGVPVLTLAYLSGARKLALASLVFVVLALGTYTPLYGWYRAMFLPEQVIRYPERHLAGAVVLWSALAGVGFGRLFNEPVSTKTLRAWTVAGGLFLLAAACALLFGDSVAERLRVDALAAGVDSEAGFGELTSGGLTAALATALFVASLWLRRVERYARLAYPIALLALLWPLLRESVRSQPVLDRELISDVPALLAPVVDTGGARAGRPRLYRHRSVNPEAGQLPEHLRFASLYHTAVPNTATAHGFAYVPGYDPSLSARLRTTWELASQFGGRMLQLYDIEYAFLPEPVARAGGMRVVTPSLDPRLVLARQEKRRPRAFVTQHWQRVAGEDEVRARLFGPTFDPASITLIGEPGASSRDEQPKLLVPCQMQSEVPERVTLQCTSEMGGYAVLLDAWAPGWTATLDGKQVPIERADSVVRAVAMPTGSHTINFAYRTPGLVIGALVSLVSWLLVLLGLFLCRDSRASKTKG